MGKKEIPLIDEERYGEDPTNENSGRDPDRQPGEGILKFVAGVAGGVALCIALEGKEDPFIKDAIEFIVGFGVARFGTNKLIKIIKNRL